MEDENVICDNPDYHKLIFYHHVAEAWLWEAGAWSSMWLWFVFGDRLASDTIYGQPSLSAQVLFRFLSYRAKLVFNAFVWRFMVAFIYIRAVYTRENKPRLTLAAAYVSREQPVKMVQNLRSRLSQATSYPGLGVYTRINSSFRGLRKPRPELAAAYFLSYKRPYCR